MQRVYPASTIETLESRRLFAGNIGVTLTPDGLLVQGDNKANNIAIVASTTAISITGIGTDITTTAPGAVAIPGGHSFPLPSGVKVDLGNGDDAVALSGTFVDVDLDIETANGNDAVVFTQGLIDFSKVEVDTGNGNDTVRFGAWEFFDCEVDINLGNGNDTFAVDESLTFILSSARIDGGSGNDISRGEDNIADPSSTVELLRFEHHVA